MSERIYIAVAPSGLVKLGFSANPERRALALRSPLGERAELVLHFAGTMDFEQAIHRHLQEKFGTKCEWYPSTVRDLFAAVQVVVGDESMRELNDALSTRMAQAKQWMTKELTAVAEEAIAAREPRLSEDRAVEAFAEAARSLVALINGGIQKAGEQSRAIVESAEFVDADLAEQLLAGSPA